MKQNSNSKTPQLHPGYALEYHKLKALFDDDPDFIIGELDDQNKICTVTIKDKEKEDLFTNLINLQYLNIRIAPHEIEPSELSIARLFDTNPHFSRYFSTEVEDGLPLKAALFKPECMSYYSDDFSSPTGWTAILPEDLAKELIVGEFNIKTDLAN